MAKIYDMNGQRRSVGIEEFMELLKTLEMYIEELRPLRQNQDHLNEALDIITIMKWNGSFSPKFRDELTVPLEELLDTVFIEIQQVNEPCTSA